MSHTLAAVFDNRTNAESARAELVNSGIAAAAVRLSATSASTADASTQTAGLATDPGEHSLGDSIKNFFSNLFSDDDHDRAVYGEAINRGNVVLTVQAETELEVERAATIVERFGPIDIDEHRSQWEAGGWIPASAQLGGAPLSASRQSGSLQGASQSGSLGTSVSDAQGSQQRLAGTGSQQRAGTESQVIPIMEEELKVGKRTVQRGGVRIYQRLVETPVQESVSLREEHVNVERRPVDRPVDPSQVGAFQETSFELREHAEEAVVQKTARVVEEVVVGKEITQRTDQISDTVRHTEVEVEQLVNNDDDYYRSHWMTNYQAAGGSFDDYAPAYRYGSEMRSDAGYAGRSWDESESGLRSSWESRYPQSAWEKFKAAVRHGWERMTS